jgi:hypothetical protein
VRALILTACLLVPQALEAATLYVDVATGDDSRTYATAQNPATPWASVYRAVRGCALASQPCSSAGTAAQTGDTVNVAGGTYDFPGACTAGASTCRFQPIYEPLNSGVTLTAVGTVTLTGALAVAPAIGAGNVNDVKFFADLTVGSWTIPACDVAGSGSPPNDCPANSWASVSDTGPGVCANVTNCWIEGARITGVQPIAFADNWEGLRFDGCVSCTFRNNVIVDFTRTPTYNHNQACITVYGTSDSLVEHNSCTTAGVMVYFKDTGSTPLQSGNIARYNRADDVNECIAWSHVTGGSTEDRNDVYQNVCTNVDNGIVVLGATNDVVWNNTIVTIATGCLFTNNNANISGVRVWNNICTASSAYMIVANATTMPAATMLSSQHQNYFTFANFYGGSDGNRTFANYLATYTDQDQTAPASLNSDPIFVNAGTEDFRLCTGVDTPVVGCSGASPALTIGRNPDTSATIPAGAYITNLECIGPEYLCTPVATTGPVRLRLTPPDFGLEVR